MDFTRKYRPTNLNQLAGQRSIVSVLRGLIGPGFTSGSLLLHGPAGVGKTTVARIVAMSLNCEDRTESNDPCGKCTSCIGVMSGSSFDVSEINAAKNRGINEARAFDDNLIMSPMVSPFKVLILDEAHALTKEAQDSLLKSVEEPPRNVCIILCSTEPKKIKKTIRDRCKEFKFNNVSKKSIEKLLVSVVQDEGVSTSVSTEILGKIAAASEGSPRIALNKLQQLILSDGSDETLSDLLSSTDDTSANIMVLCKKLCFANSDTRWLDIVKTYKEVSESYSIESLRIVICGFLRSLLEKTSNFSNLTMYSECLDLFLVPLTEVKPENAFVNNLFKVYSIIKVRNRNAWAKKG